MYIYNKTDTPNLELLHSLLLHNIRPIFLSKEDIRDLPATKLTDVDSIVVLTTDSKEAGLKRVVNGTTAHYVVLFNEHLFANTLHNITLLNIEDLVPKTNYTNISSVAGLDTFLNVARTSEYVVFDCETASSKYDDEDANFKHYDKEFKVRSIGFSFNRSDTIYIISVEEFTGTDRLVMLKAIQDMLDTNMFLVGHNTKFDLHCLSSLGLTVYENIHDTMIMGHLLDEEHDKSLKDYTSYVYAYLGYEEELNNYLRTYKLKVSEKWDKLPIQHINDYLAIDILITKHLFVGLSLEIQKIPKLVTYYMNLSMPALFTFFLMEKRGIATNISSLYSAIVKADEYIAAIQEDIKAIPILSKYIDTKSLQLKETYINDKVNTLKALPRKKDGSRTISYYKLEEELRLLHINGYTYSFNLNSPKQLIEFLYDYLKCPIMGYKRSTDETTIMDLANNKRLSDDIRIFCDKLLEYRGLCKAKSNLTNISSLVQTTTNCIHSSYNCAGTVTGRVSSNRPNMQNLPVWQRLQEGYKKKLIKVVREAFTPREGNILVDIDFSQVELRMIAAFAQDATMLQAFNDGKDLHRLTAANMLSLSLEEFDALPEKKQRAARQGAKAVNFGKIYLQGLVGFCRTAKLIYNVSFSIDEAKVVDKVFFSTYPKIQDYHIKYVKLAQRKGFTETLLFRRRHLPRIYSLENKTRAEAERQAVNSPIQGSCGEIALFVMSQMRRLYPEIAIVNTVHDSIMFEYNSEEYVLNAFADIMCTLSPEIERVFNRVFRSVKLTYEHKVGKNWAEL